MIGFSDHPADPAEYLPAPPERLSATESGREPVPTPPHRGEPGSQPAVNSAFRPPRRKRKDPRKTRPEHQLPFLTAMLESFAERAKEQDARVGLAAMQELSALARRLTNEVGRAVVERDGAAEVSRQVGTTVQAVWQRWGSRREECSTWNQEEDGS